MVSYIPSVNRLDRLIGLWRSDCHIYPNLGNRSNEAAPCVGRIAERQLYAPSASAWSPHYRVQRTGKGYKDTSSPITSDCISILDTYSNTKYDAIVKRLPSNDHCRRNGAESCRVPQGHFDLDKNTWGVGKLLETPQPCAA